MRGAEVDGRYDVIEAIGEGGFGWVFQVEHKLLGQRFAMKILHPDIAQDRDWISRFREEAKATGLIGHESIVFVTDFGACPKYGYYFVMEYLDGQTLGDYLLRQDDRQADLRLVRQFATTAAAALGAVHELDIVHCDLKPGNVMLIKRRGGYQFKFLDFGTSTIVASAGKSDMVFGTPAYMAPEQATGLAVDHRADVFSVACILYEMIGGKEPWYTENWNDAFPEMRERYPPDGLEYLRSDVSADVDEVIRKGLAMGRTERWPDVESMVEALLEVLEIEESDFEPLDDPFDMIRVDDQFARSLTAPRVNVPRDASSMIIELGDIDLEDSEARDESVRTEIKVVYRTANRLRREWRRNVIAGGMFLPAEERPMTGEGVRLVLTYLPGQTTISLNARVVSQRDDADGNPLGFGVRFEDDESKKFRKFIRDLQLGLDLSHEDVLRRVRDFDPDAPLSAGEAFILSRLDDPLPFGRIRAMCSGLPFEVESCVDALLDRGWIRAESRSLDENSLTEVTEIFERNPAEASPVGLSDEDIKSVHETVTFFVDQRNYMAAVHVLKNAISLSSGHMPFRIQYIELTHRFLGDAPEARRAVQAALNLDPQNDDLLKLAQLIE